MTTSDNEASAADRLEAAGDRIAEAKSAAADVAEQESLSPEEREDAATSVAGSPADDIVGHATGEGAEVAPG